MYLSKQRFVETAVENLEVMDGHFVLVCDSAVHIHDPPHVGLGPRTLGLAQECLTFQTQPESNG